MGRLMQGTARGAAQRVLLALAVVGCLLLHAVSAPATVDGGIDAQLHGSFANQRYAFLVEMRIQEGCMYGACLAYVVDLSSDEFALTFPQQLEARNEVLSKELCAKLEKEECTKRVSQRLLEEEQDEQTLSQLLAEQYLSSLLPERRAQLGDWKPAPRQLKLASPDSVAPTLDVVVPALSQPKAPLQWTLSLEERWTAASYRAYTEDDTQCRPEQLSTCKKELRWVDGVRSQRFACTGPCAGLASMVRVVAHPKSHLQPSTRLGRSSLVEPGAIASYAVGMVNSRRIPLPSLTIASYSARAYAFASQVIVVGGFVEGAGSNGTWFPLVITLPRQLSSAKAIAQTPGPSAGRAGSKKPPPHEPGPSVPKTKAPQSDDRGCALSPIPPPNVGRLWWALMLLSVLSGLVRRRPKTRIDIAPSGALRVEVVLRVESLHAIPMRYPIQSNNASLKVPTRVFCATCTGPG